jgi:hypothetical protein
MADHVSVPTVLPPTLDGVEVAIEAWARSSPLRELVSAFGGEVPSGGALGDLLAWLAAFSERWDYRGGRERNLVDAPDLDDAASELVLRSAASLGLVGESEPRETSYDHVLVLGGLARACLARPLHAARLLRQGRVSTGAVVALGGYRPLKGDELSLVERVVGDQELANEYDVMDAGVRRAFGLDAPTAERGEESETVGMAWRVRDYRLADDLVARVVAAPSTEPGRRANTPDTYRWFARELGQLDPGQRLLLVTSDIYRPYQHADALRMLALPYGVEVDTIGIRPGAIDPRLAQEFRPHNYLQEIRSTILAFRNLLLRVREGPPHLRLDSRDMAS